LFNDILTLSAAGRYDKQTNFEGKFTPRVAAVIRVAKDNIVFLIKHLQIPFKPKSIYQPSYWWWYQLFNRLIA
jgi:hypothetical protein